MASQTIKIQYLDESIPKLTYVGINSGKSGYLAARTLYHMMLAKEENWLSEMIVTRPELIIRETCLGKKRE